MAMTNGSGFIALGNALGKAAETLGKLELAEQKSKNKLFAQAEENKAISFFNERLKQYSAAGYSKSVAATKALDELTKKSELGTFDMGTVLSSVKSYTEFVNLNTEVDNMIAAVKDNNIPIPSHLITGLNNGSPIALYKAKELVDSSINLYKSKQALEQMQTNNAMAEELSKDYINSFNAVTDHSMANIISDVFSGEYDFQTAVGKFNELYDKQIDDIQKLADSSTKKFILKNIQEKKRKDLTALLSVAKDYEGYKKAVKETEVTDLEATRKFYENKLAIVKSLSDTIDLTTLGETDAGKMINNLTAAISQTDDSVLKSKLINQLNSVMGTMAVKKDTLLALSMFIDENTMGAIKKIHKNENLTTQDVYYIATKLIETDSMLQGTGQPELSKVAFLATLSTNTLQYLKSRIEKDETDIKYKDKILGLLNKYINIQKNIPIAPEGK